MEDVLGLLGAVVSASADMRLICREGAESFLLALRPIYAKRARFWIYGEILRARTVVVVSCWTARRTIETGELDDVEGIETLVASWAGRRWRSCITGRLATIWIPERSLRRALLASSCRCQTYPRNQSPQAGRGMLLPRKCGSVSPRWRRSGGATRARQLAPRSMKRAGSSDAAEHGSNRTTHSTWF